MGQFGPIPNRDADLARPRSRKGTDYASPDATKGTARQVQIPKADPNWHSIAKMVWNSLAESGQSEFYQQSDWALAYSLCEDLSDYKKQSRRSGQMLSVIYSTMGELLVSEGARRRARIELEQPVPESEPASVTAIAAYKASLGVVNE